jgi:hypothetical protein
MKRDVVSGTLLIAGAVAGVIVMVFHPTGHGVQSAAEGHGLALVNVMVHSLALCATPVVFLGLLGLARAMGPTDLTTAALVGWGFGAVAVMSAAVASGFVAPAVMQHIVAAENSRVPEAFLLYTGLWNQGFAKVYVSATSISMLLWSAAMLRGRDGSVGPAVAGIVVGVAALLGVLSGLLHLDVHGFGVVTFAQSAWLIWLGILLCRGRGGVD